MRRFKKRSSIFFVVTIVILVVYTVQIYNIMLFPSQIDIFRGENKSIDVLYPFTLKLLQQEDESPVLSFINSTVNDKSLNVSIKTSYKLETINRGNAKLVFNLFGVIPIKNVNVNVVDNIYLIPGGNTIGVKLNTKGVLVVALSNDLVGVDDKKYSPAIDAGIKVGDVITSINGIEVKNSNHVIDLLNRIGEEKVDIKVIRNKHEFTAKVKPVKCKQDNSYRLGIWVRDKTAGIGTLTFYHPDSKKFGALGHGITDIDTGSLMPIKNGEILKAKISSIEQGKKGTPGELKGIFFDTTDMIGSIEKNTSFGIYGVMNEKNEDIFSREALPVGLQNQVKIGKAHILCTINEDRIEKYEIEILKTEIQGYPKQKSMVIKIVDERLLEETGGIVQGMSGSPIIQDGKIIGAVTHVFINDPTKGYGIYINWMLKNAGILLDNNKDLAIAK